MYLKAQQTTCDNVIIKIFLLFVWKPTVSSSNNKSSPLKIAKSGCCLSPVMIDGFGHSHRKWKDSLETRTKPVIFSL